MSTDVALESCDAAPVLGVGVQTLKVWRRNGTGPKFIRFGNRVRYRLSDLEAWLADHTVTPGPQAAKAD